MTGRWRGRRAAGLVAIGLAALLTAGAAAGAGPAGGRVIVVRDEAGTELVRAGLPASGEFSLSYRNSIYHSLGEEHYRLEGERLVLTGLAAEEVAVLEEYSNAFGAVRGAPGSGLTWSVEVDRPPIDLPLSVQATALGERTLIVDGSRIPLWQLVEGRDDASVTIGIEGGA